MKISHDEIKKMLSLGKTLYKDDTTEAEQIAGLFPRGYMSILASPPGSGKTWFTLYLACQLSTGGEILNGLTTSKPQKVLIFAGETARSIYEMRLARTQWKFNPDNVIIFSAYELGVNKIPYLLNTVAGQENMNVIVNELKPDVIIFDTLISYHTLDESKQSEMTFLYNFLNRLANYYNCAVICNHHTRKRRVDNPDREQNQDDVIGSSAGIRLASTVYIIKSEETEEGLGATRMTVKNVKSWNEKIPTFSYEFINEGKYIDFLVNLNVNEKWSTKSRLKSLINSIDGNAVLQVNELAANLKVTEKTVRNTLDKFADENIIERFIFNNNIAYRLPK